MEKESIANVPHTTQHDDHESTKTAAAEALAGGEAKAPGFGIKKRRQQLQGNNILVMLEETKKQGEERSD